MATTDVLTLEATKTAIRASLNTTLQDDRYRSLITAASQWLDRMCGPIVRRAVTERHDGGQPWIWMRACPLYEITAIVEYASGTPTTLTAEDVATAGTYMAEPDSTIEPPGLLNGRIWRRSSFCDLCFPHGRQTVLVTAVAGRYATTEDVVGSRFEQAALIWVKWAAQAYTLQAAAAGDYAVPFPTFPRTIPQAVQELLSEDWREPVAIG